MGAKPSRSAGVSPVWVMRQNPKGWVFSKMSMRSRMVTRWDTHELLPHVTGGTPPLLEIRHHRKAAYGCENEGNSILPP